MAMEKQHSWGWQVVMDVFLGGIGAGLFLVSFIVEQLFGVTPLTTVGAIVGPVLVLLGIFFLLIEVGKPMNAVRAFLNAGTSWMSRGVILQPILIAVALLYALLPLGVPGIKTAAAGIVIGGIAAILAILVAVYHGFLFSQARGIALWNNPLLPMLYFVSALAGGAGVLLLITPLFNVAVIAGQLAVLVIVEIALVVLVLVSIWLMAAVRPSLSYRRSLRQLMTPNFIGLTLVLGNAVPLVLLVVSLFIAGTGASVAVLSITGALVLVGTYYLRHAVIRAGHHYSLQVSF
ncbi:MAG: NrfD/PsrC family molybdoenzyme membrane anchor subunit [Chloroflexota bacterium]|nr:NrfD/PsrC family molybdoenzyme membrane anchor subunit [Chloroflexota bacterium]